MFPEAGPARSRPTDSQSAAPARAFPNGPIRSARNVAIVPSVEGRLCSPLLVIPNGAAQISDPRYEGYLRCELLFRTRLWEHVADVGNLTLGLLRRLIELQTIRFAGCVLQLHCF